jgi:hypothetical protein
MIVTIFMRIGRKGFVKAVWTTSITIPGNFVMTGIGTKARLARHNLTHIGNYRCPQHFVPKAAGSR